MTLTPFEGRDVVRSTISVTNAGDGLSESLKVEPTEFHHGDTVYVVLETEVVKVQHVPFDKADPHGELTRVHILKAGTATIVDADLVAKQIREQADRILAAKEAEAGILRLDVDGELEDLENDLAEAEAQTGVEGDPVTEDTDWEEPPPAEPAKPRGRTTKKA